MFVAIAFNLVLVSQIVLLSCVLPWFLAKAAAFTKSHRYTRYMLANKLVAIAGVGLIVLYSLHPLFASAKPVLLGLGTLFILQMLALAQLPALAEKNPPGRPVINPLKPYSLFDAINRSAVLIACLLAAAYTIMMLASISKGHGEQHLQLAVFVLTNMLLAGAVAKDLYGVKHYEGEQKIKSIKSLGLMAPLCIYLSIFLSLYYFGKQLLLQLELNELRPMMMSIFMQLLGVLVGYLMFKAYSAKRVE